LLTSYHQPLTPKNLSLVLLFYRARYGQAPNWLGLWVNSLMRTVRHGK